MMAAVYNCTSKKNLHMINGFWAFIAGFFD